MKANTIAELQDEVLEIFARVTRYPIEILDLKASLEEDLGVDSVKLGEIFSILREEFHLPEKLDIPVERLKTIEGISQALHEYFSHGVGSRTTAGTIPLRDLTESRAETPAYAASTPSLAVMSQQERRHGMNFETTEARVREIFAQVTRYPIEILDVHASLEEDLGIDSVKLGEIFSVLREEYRLPEKLDISMDKLRTIEGISRALDEHFSQGNGGGMPPAARQVTVEMPAQHPGGNGHSSGKEPKISAAGFVGSKSFDVLTAEHKPFSGKIAFVTGSGRGLGKEIAVYLADLGATVVVNSFHSRQRGEGTETEIKARGGDAWHLWGSMANDTQLHQIFDRIEERYGALDFFISNASNGMLASIEDLTVADWEKAFRTNVVGLHQGALRAAKLMKKNGGGKIITLSSPAAHGYVEYFGCMGPVKAAVECLTRALAIEFARYNIQVNCVSPGPIDGELLRKWPDSERLIPQWTGATPIGRLCEHRDVSHFIAYLLSEPVKAFTGSTLVLDGGISSQGW